MSAGEVSTSYSEPLTLEPFWLTFHNPQLEKLWQRAQADRRRVFDQGFHLVFILPASQASVKIWSVKSWLIARLLCPVCTLEYALLVVAIQWLPKAYMQHRTAIVTVQKVLILSVACFLELIESPPEDTWLQFVSFELIHFNKGVLLILLGILLPLTFWQHLFVQSFMVAMCLFMDPSMCTAFLKRMPASEAKYSMITSFLETAFTPYSGLLRAPTPAAASSNGASCLQVQTFLQIFQGFVLPSLFLYSTERWSRLALVKRVQPSQGSRGPEFRRSSSWASAALVLLQLYIGLAFLWLSIGWMLSRA